MNISKALIMFADAVAKRGFSSGKKWSVHFNGKMFFCYPVEKPIKDGIQICTITEEQAKDGFSDSEWNKITAKIGVCIERLCK